MRIKEIERTANISWSPADVCPIHMVTGTAAQQLDATFSTSADLEIYSLNLEDTSLDMPLISTAQSECRFHKVLWGSFGMSGDSSAGIIVGGTDSGQLLGYNASQLLKGNKDCIVLKKEKHTGAVKALDFNTFQHNLLASGGSDSEIFVWDLNKPDTPMTPGAKSQPPEEVACVAWNKQVQHIIASTFASRCVVWDLRKNEPIIKVSDSMSRIKSKLVVWHPDVATQMCLSSEDDHTPVIQLWDLRYATSPLKVFENHTRGVLSMAWSQHDSDLLLTCGKDNRILCWNPNTNIQGGEVVYELPTNNQWCFDVQWCPRNPAIMSSSSFDGHITVYSLMGGGHPIHRANKIADSFHTDPFGQGAVSQVQEAQCIIPLKKPPKWLRRPVGASFGFGGKLVTFDSEKTKSGQQAASHAVYLSHVVTEDELLNRSTQLEQAMNNKQFHEFCAMKASNSSDAMQENIWSFLKVSFERESREHFIRLLGYEKEALAQKISDQISSEPSPDQGVDAQELADKMTRLDTGDTSILRNRMAGGDNSPSWGSKTPGSRDELSDGSAAFDDIAAQSRVTHGDLKLVSPLVIPTTEDSEGLLCEALLTGNYEAAVEMCLHENKMAEAILLAIAGGTELLKKTQKKYFEMNRNSLGRLISSVVTRDWKHIVKTCSLDNWKEALAVVLSYSSYKEYSDLCDTLATRLENEGEGELSVYASLCYICSGNVEKLVENWYQNTDASNSPLALQDLVEKVTMLRKAVELSRGQVPEITTGRLSEKLSNYAGILAAQGSLDTALRYLGSSSEITLSILRERLYNAIGQNISGISPPEFPFQKINILAKGAPKQQPNIQASQTSQMKTGTSYGGYTQPRNTFQTVTTASTSYSQFQNPYAAVNGTMAAQTTGIYNPTAAAGPQLSPTQLSPKGHLSHRYPTCPAASASYGLDTYNQSQYSQPNMGGSASYSQPDYYSGYNPAVSQPVSQSMGLYNPTSLSGGSGMPTSSVQPNVSSFMDHKPTSAWNDPPVIQERKPKSSYVQPQAITAPVVGGMSQPMVNDQAPQGAPMNYSGLYNPQEHQPQPQTTFQPPVSTAPEKKTPPPQEPVKEVMKGPIPAEHQILQDIFSTLVHNCISMAKNAQTKRKLEDVTRKLELLYDRLRENSLSQNVLLGLHQIVQAVQQYDYNTGLQIYTQLVSHGNFSEISSFMPGLKMLIQSAHQLQVFLPTQ